MSEQPQQNVIEARGLAKVYRGDVRAVDGISFAVGRGEIFGFLGPNGAGKTTTIGMLLGLIHPTVGEIRIFGQRVTPAEVAPLRRVGSLVGAPALLPFASGRANLRLLAGLEPDAGRDAVEAALERVGMLHAAGRMVRTYSTGMKQRIGLAAALFHQPDLLILDEPTSGLDPAGMREIRTLIRSLAAGGVTVFLSSHLLGEVEAVCDRAAVLNHGQIVAQGAVADLLGEGEVVRVRTADPARAAEVLRTLPGISALRPNGAYVEVEGVPSEAVIEHLVGAGQTPCEVYLRRADLESVFMTLTETEQE